MTPNLFILGAGKCGTTSLYHLLQRHPDVHVSPVKEPSFFCRQFQVVKNPVDYFDLFRSPKRYRVDASHVYFSNPETAPILHALFPDARFLVILRHPKARAYALYRHMRRYDHDDGLPFEPLDTFAEALRVEAERFASPEYLVNCRQYFWNFLYLRSSAYDEQLQRYFDLFPRDRFHVMTLAEFESQPAAAIQAITHFLDLAPAGFGDDVPMANVAPDHAPFDADSDALMETFFGDLTRRVDSLLGRPLDWSR